jgi:hypothetical protein
MYKHRHALIRFGHALCNIGGEANNYYTFYLPAGYPNQCFNYPLQGVQDFYPQRIFTFWSFSHKQLIFLSLLFE